MVPTFGPAPQDEPSIILREQTGGHVATEVDPEPKRASQDDGRPTLNVVDETDGYTSALAGITAEAVRIGLGVGPNEVLAIPIESGAVADLSYGFPLTAHADIPSDRVLVAYIRENPGGSRWCGTQASEGSVVMYPPGTEHVAIAHDGLRLTYAVVETEHLMAHACALGVAADIPSHSGLIEFPRSPEAQQFVASLDRLTDRARISGALDRPAEHMLTQMVGLLADQDRVTRFGPGKGIDSREIVASCIEYAEAVARVPSLGELCTAAHVSQRRLRKAFNDEFDCSPSNYFRTWALQQAHRRLRDGDPAVCNVTVVATKLGFDHLGRFASYYNDVYGVNPSATLRSLAS